MPRQDDSAPATRGDIQLVLQKLEEHDRKFDRIDDRFGSLEGCFDGLEGRFDGLEGRFDGLEGRFDGLEGRFDGLEGRFDGLEDRFDGLEGRFDGLEKRVSDSEQHILFALNEDWKHTDQIAEDILLAMELQWNDQNDIINDKFSLMNDRMVRVEEAVGLSAA